MTKLSWLDSRHSFSFSDYDDPQHRGFRSLRVLNEDIVEPGAGFGTHPHRDAEILTYVISGELEHKDSMGNGAVIAPGALQYMSAGSGVMHSEYNPSPTTKAHFLQIWLLPAERGGEPRYAQRGAESFSGPGKHLLCSPDGRDQSIAIRQDASVSLIRFRSSEADQHLSFGGNRYGWIQVVSGDVLVSEEGSESQENLGAGDGLRVVGPSELTIRSYLAASGNGINSEISLLVFDLP